MATDHGQTMMNIDKSWNHGISIIVTGCNRYRQPSELFAPPRPSPCRTPLVLPHWPPALRIPRRGSHAGHAVAVPSRRPAPLGGPARSARWSCHAQRKRPVWPGRAGRRRRTERIRPWIPWQKKQKIVEIMGQVKWEDGGPSWILDLGLKDDGRLSFNFFATWAQVGATRTQVDPGQVQEVEWHVAAEDLCTCSQNRNVSGCLVILHL